MDPEASPVNHSLGPAPVSWPFPGDLHPPLSSCRQVSANSVRGNRRFSAVPSSTMMARLVSCYKMPIYPGTSTTTRAELSDFLKSRRARLTPATVGRQNGQRRRTPACGVRRSPTWREWASPGTPGSSRAETSGVVRRRRRPRSPRRALRLEPAERTPPLPSCRAGSAAPEPVAVAVSPPLRAAHPRRLGPPPAHVAGRRHGLEPGATRVRLVEAPRGQARHAVVGVHGLPATRRVNWDREVALAAGFRANAGRDLVESDYQELIGELLEGSPNSPPSGPGRCRAPGRSASTVRARPPRPGVHHPPRRRATLLSGSTSTRLRMTARPRPDCARSLSRRRRPRRRRLREGADDEPEAQRGS